MELLCSSGDPWSSIGAQGAGGSPDPPLPKGEHRRDRKSVVHGKSVDPGGGGVIENQRRGSLSRRQLPEARFVPFLRWAHLGPSLAGEGLGAGASAHKAFSGPIRLLPEGEHVWSCFPAPVTLGQAPVPREREAAQTLLGPRASTGLGAKPASTALLRKHALGLSLLSRGEFPFREGSSQKLVLCPF